eukprot:COSAG02_NODE_1619_length_11636_cov_26.969836_3_plen_50_part_00
MLPAALHDASRRVEPAALGTGLGTLEPQAALPRGVLQLYKDKRIHAGFL